MTGKGFMPGKSGNPNGRPRGFGSYIQQRSRDGKLLADFAFDLVEGKPIKTEMIFPAKEEGKPPTVVSYETTPPARVRLEAAQWLSDRGWGKPVQEVEVTPGGSFVVQHRLLRPGQDPLALPEGDVELPPAR